MATRSSKDSGSNAWLRSCIVVLGIIDEKSFLNSKASLYGFINMFEHGYYKNNEWEWYLKYFLMITLINKFY
jgi:hypothetical protein